MRDNSKLRNLVLDTLWQNPFIGLAIYDADHATLKDANPAFLELLDSRYRTKKTLGLPLEQCLGEIAVNGLQDVFERTLLTRAPFHSDLIRLDRPQMGPIHIACTVMALQGEGDGVAHHLLLAASERKADLPLPQHWNLVDNQTRHALSRHFHLSARELDIVAGCLQGKKNKQIAEDLHIGISTVKRHLESAYRKIGITSSRSLPLSILAVLQQATPAPDSLEICTSAAAAPIALPAAPAQRSQAA